MCFVRRAHPRSHDFKSIRFECRESGNVKQRVLGRGKVSKFNCNSDTCTRKEFIKRAPHASFTGCVYMLFELRVSEMQFWLGEPRSLFKNTSFDFQVITEKLIKFTPLVSFWTTLENNFNHTRSNTKTTFERIRTCARDLRSHCINHEACIEI